LTARADRPLLFSVRVYWSLAFAACGRAFGLATLGWQLGFDTRGNSAGLERLIGTGGDLKERGLLATFHYPLGIQQAVKLDELGYDPCPAGLVARAEAGAIVAVEVFVEEDVARQWGSVWNFSVPP
jgi:hypothetical protein